MRCTSAALVILLAAKTSADRLLDLEIQPASDGRRHLATPEPAVQQPPLPPAGPPPLPSPPHPPVSLLNYGCTPALGRNPTVSAVDTPPGTLQHPRDLAFNPAAGSGRHELWVADAGRDAMSVVQLDAQLHVLETKVVKDRAQYHYMDQVSSLSFDAKGQFATCQESLNTYEGKMLPNFFMGPTLYDTRLSFINSKQSECQVGETCFLIHVDMLHESPLCMGIAHDGGATTFVTPQASYTNVYWAFDGGHRQLVRFDFKSDHGPGSMDHSIASVRRYMGLELTRHQGVPSHMNVDAQTRELFIADTGADRVVWVNTLSGYYSRDAKISTTEFKGYDIYSSPEASFNYSVWDGLEYTTFASVPRPCGLALSTTTVYVGSYSNGHVYAFDRATRSLLQRIPVAPTDSLRGLALIGSAEAQGLFFIDGSTQTVKRLHALNGAATCPASPSHGCQDGLRTGDETDVDCGGTACQRCALTKACAAASDCASSRCVSGVCAPANRLVHRSTFLQSYLNSDFYANSFAHHLAFGNMSDHASYLNPYPIMAPGFCASVGVDQSTGKLNCSNVDFDALLLGGCWCHQCLPENPCQNGGTCNNFQGKGYTCACPQGFGGDHCQHTGADAGVADMTSAFPFYVRNNLPPPAPPPMLNMSNATLELNNTSAQSAAQDNANAVLVAALAGGLGGAAGLLLLGLAAWTYYSRVHPKVPKADVCVVSDKLGVEVTSSTHSKC